VSVIKTKVNPQAASFRSNHAAMLAEVKKLEAELEKVRQGGAEKYHVRHRNKGKLKARERLELLLDRDSPYLELMPLVGHSVKDGTVGGALISGIGRISGTWCAVSASEPTVKAGSINQSGGMKNLRMNQIIEDNRLPTVGLVESAGADLPHQADVFVPAGKNFYSLTRRSKQKVPSVCVVLGNSTAGGAYMPGMSDYVVMVQNQAQVFLAGPPLVKMATNEETDEEALGGADMHSRISGVSDYLASDEVEAIRLAREIVANLHWPNPGEALRSARVEEPRYDPDEILGIASADIRVPFDQKEIIARIIDGSDWNEFKPTYGTTLPCGWARIHGFPVGILANNGIIFSESAQKGAQFIALSNQADTPLVFLQNINGFMVGRRYEEGGIIKNGAKLINAVTNSTVPHLTVMTGASYGAGNYGMSGRAMDPRFLFTWPNHRIAVMGPEQLAGVLDIVKRDAAARDHRNLNEEEEKQLAFIKQMIEAQIGAESSPYFSTGRLWDDGIIDPRQTREVLGICLGVLNTQAIQGTTSWGVFRH
jgi:acyl-CoA carboxylase subunit beta